MKQFYSTLSIILLACLLQLQSHAQQIAFPGAEGAGRFASGGRGTALSPTTVFEVTNLGDVNSPGSLRYACAQSVNTYPNRTIVFRVSGTIHLTSKLGIPRNTTIAGQTAPGGGICLADFPVVISGDNVIVRYIRIRMGDKNQLKTTPSGCGVPVAPFSASCMPLDGSGGDDAFGDLGHKNLIIDHCSVSWSSDEALTFYRGDSLTLQWNLISEPLNYSYHFETGDTDFENHGYGGIWGAQHASFHHNLIAHARNRTPRFAGNSTYPAGAIESADFRNNVLYNWGINDIYGGDGGQYNLVNNYYKYGPNTSAGVKFRVVTVDKSDAFPFAKYYLSGNYVDGSPANTANNWTGAYMSSGVQSDTVLSKVLTPFLADYLPSTTHTALQAYDTVLKGAGCVIPLRDTLDQRVVNDVKNRTGKIIDVQGNFAHGTPYDQTVNAWPTLATGTAPADADHDGMADAWETANGLNPANAADRAIVAANGYTNLENYLNSIDGTPTGEVEEPAPNSIATWTLLTDQTPTVSGNITATNQALGSNVAGIQYGSSFGTVAGWQRSDNTSFLPIGYDANNYLEYSVTATNGQIFTAKSLELGALGGGTGTARLSIYYSLDNFATSFPAGPITYNGATTDGSTTGSASLLNTSTTPLTVQQKATIPMSVAVQPGQTLTLRMYMWITGTGNRYFASQNVILSGVSADPSLPLSLIKFSAALQNNRSVLQWQTAHESGMREFEIEKSNDGRSFKSIGKLNAQNRSSGNYVYTDNNATQTVQYYRLKMINKDGTYSYSFVVTINGALRGGISIFPNPAGNILTVTHKASVEKNDIAIYDTEGKRVLLMPVSPNSTQTSFTINQLAKGTYFLSLSSDAKSDMIKFVKQ